MSNESVEIPVENKQLTNAPYSSSASIEPKPPVENNTNTHNSVQEEEEEEQMDVGFALRSLSALIKPVSITMILTALCTVHLTSPNDTQSNNGLKY